MDRWQMHVITVILIPSLDIQVTIALGEHGYRIAPQQFTSIFGTVQMLIFS